jgi:hypothetical protein
MRTRIGGAGSEVGSGKQHKGLIKKLDRTRHVANRRVEIFWARHGSSTVHCCPGQMPSPFHALESHSEHRILVALPLNCGRHPVPGGADQDVGLVGILNQLRVDRDGVISRGSLETAEHAPAELRGLAELSSKVGRLSAYWRILTVGWFHRCQEYKGKAANCYEDQAR